MSRSHVDLRSAPFCAGMSGALFRTVCSVTLATGCGVSADHTGRGAGDSGSAAPGRAGEAAMDAEAGLAPVPGLDGGTGTVDAPAGSGCPPSSSPGAGAAACSASPSEAGSAPGGGPPGEDPNAWKRIYDDEFDSFDAALWQTQFWWGNGTIHDGSICYFSPHNVSVHDGAADLLVNNNHEGGSNFTGAIMESYGTIHFTYGYVELRARCDRGPGLSCDFALNADDRTWPPEINIAEIPYSQSQHDQYYVANHRRPDNLLHDHFPSGDDSTQWHTYGLLWDKGAFTWYFEGKEVYSEMADVFDAPMNFSLFYGVAANDWSGHVDSTTPFPAHARVDYVRIYQRK